MYWMSSSFRSCLLRERRLLLARVAAILIFLGLFLLGTSSLGIIFFPLATEPADVPSAYAAHFVAVTAAGLCAASLVLALQGLLISLLGARLFRAISSFLQSLVVMVLSIVLFLFPVFSRSLEALIQSGATAVRWFPPFWFLGVYESIVAGPSALPAFTQLAHTGYKATALLMAARNHHVSACVRAQHAPGSGGLHRTQYQEPACSACHPRPACDAGTNSTAARRLSLHKPDIVSVTTPPPLPCDVRGGGHRAGMCVGRRLTSRGRPYQDRDLVERGTPGGSGACLLDRRWAVHLAPLSRRSGRKLGLSADPRQGLIGSPGRYQTLGVALGNDHDPRRSCRFANHLLPRTTRSEGTGYPGSA